MHICGTRWRWVKWIYCKFRKVAKWCHATINSLHGLDKISVISKAKSLIISYTECFIFHRNFSLVHSLVQMMAFYPLHNQQRAMSPSSLVPWQSLPLIWRLGTSRFHLWVPDKSAWWVIFKCIADLLEERTPGQDSSSNNGCQGHQPYCLNQWSLKSNMP